VKELESIAGNSLVVRDLGRGTGSVVFPNSEQTPVPVLAHLKLVVAAVFMQK
jgi:hypothetical protein